MQWDETPRAILFLLASASVGGLAIAMLARRAQAGARALAGVLLGFAVWAGALALLSSPAPWAGRLVWLRLLLSAILLSPPAWFLFIRRATQPTKRESLPTLALLALPPLAGLVFAWAGPLPGVAMELPGLFRFGPSAQWGPFWFPMIVLLTFYSFGLLLTGTLFLLRGLRQASPWFSPALIALIAGVLLPWAHLAFLLASAGSQPAWLGPVVFVAAAGLIAYAVLRLGLMDLAPVARGAVLESLPEGVILFDRRERVRDANAAALHLLGKAAPEVIGQPIRHVLSAFPELAPHLNGDTRVETELSSGRGDHQRCFHFQILPLEGNGSGLDGMLVVLQDVSDHRKARRDLEISHDLLKATIEASAEGILVVTGDGEPVRYNRRLLDMWRLTEEEARGATEQVLMDAMLDQLVNPSSFYRLMNHLGANPEADSYDVLELKDGRVLERSSRPMYVSDRRSGRVWSFRDITEQRRAEDKLRYISSHDILTGLFNRMYFEEEINRLENSRQYPISIIMADVDNLKEMNDLYGHPSGDALLRKAAEALRQACRVEDVVARLGGDEFGIILPYSNEHVAEKAIARIQTMLSTARVGVDELPVSLSIGYATAQSGDSLRRVHKLADQSMYRAKEEARRKHGRTGKTGPLAMGL